MSDTISFEQAVTEIEAAYKKLGHKLGWRFLTVSKDVLQNNPQIAMITGNPGDRKIPLNHGKESCENGCAYLSEKWGDSAIGQNPLQKQVQQLFENIATQIKGAPVDQSDRDALIKSSLIAYYIPFRSPSIKELANKPKSLEFAHSLWTRLFEQIHSKLIITMEPDSFRTFDELLQQRFPEPPPEFKNMQTGWGAYTAKVKRFGQGETTTTLVQLPHLSRFKLFGRPASEPHVDELLAYACEHLK